MTYVKSFERFVDEMVDEVQKMETSVLVEQMYSICEYVDQADRQNMQLLDDNMLYGAMLRTELIARVVCWNVGAWQRAERQHQLLTELAAV